MWRSFEATVDEDGVVHLLEPADLPVGGRVLITVLDEPAAYAAEFPGLREGARSQAWVPAYGDGRQYSLEWLKEQVVTVLRACLPDRAQ
ncbi:MAG: hypothetical protein RRC07_15200 [Anaerolineae bacterium]|nr:hypothetical protein [Anaerolineae bacterium]